MVKVLTKNQSFERNTRNVGSSRKVRKKYFDPTISELCEATILFGNGNGKRDFFGALSPCNTRPESENLQVKI